MTVLSFDALRMKLHAIDRPSFMLDCHDLIVAGQRRHAKGIWQGVWFDRKRVITNDFKGLRYIFEQNTAGMIHIGQFPMPDLLGCDDNTAFSLPNGLVSKTDPENWKIDGSRLDHIYADAGLIWRTRTWREDYTIRLKGERFFNRQLVIPHDVGISTNVGQIMGQIIDKAVIVIDEENH